MLLLANAQKDDPGTWRLIREAATKDSIARVRGKSLELLARGQQHDPITWQLIHKAATQDHEGYVRSIACGLLLEKLSCTELHRKLMSQLFDGRWLWHDPKMPITFARVAEAAQRLKLDEDEVRRHYEALADELPIELTLEWRKPS